MRTIYDTNPGFGRRRFGQYLFGRLYPFNDEGTRKYGHTTFGKGGFGRNKPPQVTQPVSLRRRTR